MPVKLQIIPNYIGSNGSSSDFGGASAERVRKWPESFAAGLAIRLLYS